MDEFALLVCKKCDKPFAVPSVMITDSEYGGEGYRCLKCPYCESDNDVSDTFKEHFHASIKIEKKTIFTIKGE